MQRLCAELETADPRPRRAVKLFQQRSELSVE